MVTTGVSLYDHEIKLSIWFSPWCSKCIAIVRRLLLLSLPLSHWFKLILRIACLHRLSVGLMFLALGLGAYRVAVFM
jgi:hypothetical protein